MKTNLETRLRRLEKESGGFRRLISLWDDGTGKAQAEAAAIEREHGNKVDVVIFSWITVDPPYYG